MSAYDRWPISGTLPLDCRQEIGDPHSKAKLIRTLGRPEYSFCFWIKIIVNYGPYDRCHRNSTIRIGSGDRFIFCLVNSKYQASIEDRTVNIFENPVNEI